MIESKCDVNVVLVKQNLVYKTSGCLVDSNDNGILISAIIANKQAQ